MPSPKKSTPKNIEKVTDLKKQTTDEKTVKKGYNEKNPVQPEGSFKPDSRPTRISFSPAVSRVSRSPQQVPGKRANTNR